MPKKVEDCVKAMKKKGTKESRAWAICQESYNKAQKRK